MRKAGAAWAAAGALAAIVAAAWLCPLPNGTVVVPEGFRLDQVFARLSSQLGVDESALWAIEADASAREVLAGIPVPTLEGLVPPLTYRLPRRRLGRAPDARRVLETMVARWPDGLARFYGADFDPASGYETLIVASLVEKETAEQTERPLVASVIRNRLAEGMRLELCSSLLYALPPGRSGITAVDLSLLSPYNTYLHGGLPPSPICSPGRAAFAAAANPSETGYLYFRLTGEGGHRFSKSYAEHMAGAGE